MLSVNSDKERIVDLLDEISSKAANKLADSDDLTIETTDEVININRYTIRKTHDKYSIYDGTDCIYTLNLLTSALRIVRSLLVSPSKVFMYEYYDRSYGKQCDDTYYYLDSYRRSNDSIYLDRYYESINKTRIAKSKIFNKSLSI